MEYPEEKNTFAMEDEFLLGKCNLKSASASLVLSEKQPLSCCFESLFVGKDLLVKPVTTQGQNSIDVYLPGKDQVGQYLLIDSLLRLRTEYNNNMTHINKRACFFF